jgi:hypothetical protein
VNAVLTALTAATGLPGMIVSKIFKGILLSDGGGFGKNAGSGAGDAGSAPGGVGRAVPPPQERETVHTPFGIAAGQDAATAWRDALVNGTQMGTGPSAGFFDTGSNTSPDKGGIRNRRGLI